MTASVAALPTARDGGPWRILVLDRDPGDPKWVLCLVSLAGDVQPAAIDGDGHVADWVDVVRWVTGRTGRSAILTRMRTIEAWRIDDEP